MNTKYLFTAIAVVIVLVIAFFAINNQNNTETKSNEETGNFQREAVEKENTNTATSTNNPVPEQSQTPTTIESPAPDGNDVAVFEIDYNGTTYTPASITIKNGDVVVFKNNSSKSFWPASGPHPTHTGYPSFDPKKSISAGQTWQFKFTQSGTWPFHDHLNSSAGGEIIVQ